MQTVEKAGEEILRRTGAILSGHFVLTSGLHADAYVNKDLVYAHPEQAMKMCSLMARLVDEEDNLLVDTVVGPAYGAIGYALVIASLLPTKPRAVFTDKDGTIRPSLAQFVRGKRVLVAEDILTSGGTAIKVAEAVQQAGGLVEGVVAMVNRGLVTAKQLQLPWLGAVVELNLQTWSAGGCPLCQQGVPINTEVGHGAEFLKAKEAQLRGG